jgi:small subunit ribosomal protein S15
VVASSFHTTSILPAAAAKRQRQTQSAKKRNIQRTQERLAQEAETQPSVVLGTRSREEGELWANSDLAKCLVNSHSLNGPPEYPSEAGSSSASSGKTPSNLTETVKIPDLGTNVRVPKNTNYGIDAVDKEMLFKELPVLSAQAPFVAATSSFKATFDPDVNPPDLKDLQQNQAAAVTKEKTKLDAFAKVIDIRNANAKGVAYENKRRIVLMFSTPETPFDTGRAEVQGPSYSSFEVHVHVDDISFISAALLTYQIRNLWNHLTTFKRDVGNRRGLLKLVHQRAKILRYLKKTDQDRYEAVLPRLALDPQSVEGELVI